MKLENRIPNLFVFVMFLLLYLATLSIGKEYLLSCPGSRREKWETKMCLGAFKFCQLGVSAADHVGQRCSKSKWCQWTYPANSVRIENKFPSQITEKMFQAKFCPLSWCYVQRCVLGTALKRMTKK